MVRLLLDTKQYMLYSEGGFNPTMVRLLLRRFLKNETITLSFQSHNGAIAAGGV